MTTPTLPDATGPAVGAGFTEHYVQVDGFTIRYLESGQGQPLVVLHGAGGMRTSHALDLLARDHRVLMIEMPGFGEQPDEVHQTLDEFAGVVADVVAAIGVERYHLLGTSFGGAVATHLAMAHPDRILSLVLEAPAVFREGGVPPVGLPPEEVLRRFRVHPERKPAFQPPDPAYMGRTWPLVDRLVGALPPFDQDVADRIATLAVRTLVLFGDRDGIVPPENGRTWRRLMSNCFFTLVHDAAHDIQGDRAEAFSEVVGDWIDQGVAFLLSHQDSLINP